MWKRGQGLCGTLAGAWWDRGQNHSGTRGGIPSRGTRGTGDGEQREEAVVFRNGSAVIEMSHVHVQLTCQEEPRALSLSLSLSLSASSLL